MFIPATKNADNANNGGERVIERVVEKEKSLGPQQLQNLRRTMEESMKREILEQGRAIDDERLRQVIPPVTIDKQTIQAIAVHA